VAWLGAVRDAGAVLALHRSVLRRRIGAGSSEVCVMSATKVSLGIAVAILTGVPPLFAQASSASIAGVVSVAAPGGDPLVMPGAPITLTCGPGAALETNVTDEHGTFRFTHVPVASCTLVATLDGFRGATKR
jgi:hypothetical protein